MQFTLIPQSSQIGVCFVQPLLKRAWIRTIPVILIRPWVWTYYGSLQAGRTGNSEIGKLFHPRWMGKASWPKNRMFKVGHQICLEVATLPRWVGQRPPQVEHHMKTGVGVVAPGMDFPYCLHFAEKGAPMPHAKMPSLPPNCSGQGHGPQTTVCMRSAGFYRQWNPWSGCRCLPWMVSSGAKHPPLLIPEPVNGGPSHWAGPELWWADLHGTTGLGRFQSRGRAWSHAPQWAFSSLQAWSPSSGTSRQEGTTALGMQHHTSQLIPIHRPLVEPGAFPHFPPG